MSPVSEKNTKASEWGETTTNANRSVKSSIQVQRCYKIVFSTWLYFCNIANEHESIFKMCIRF